MKYLPQDKFGFVHTGYQQQVKEANIKRIFDLVRSGKCKSRAEIVRHMNLSATSVSVLVEELANRKLIDETGPAQTSLPGRRPISLRLNKTAHHLAVFSVKPEGVRFALMSLECRILEDRFFPLDCHTLDDSFVRAAYGILFHGRWRELRRGLFRSRAVMIGVCFPGIFIEQDHMFHTETALGFPLSEESIRRFQKRVGLPVFLFNSTRSMAYAEKKYLDTVDPDAPDTQNLIFVTIRRSIRCSFISNGDIYPGPFNVSGEIGHFTVDYRGRPCSCGNRGCLERYVNLDAILEDARQAATASVIEPPDSLEALARRYPGEPALLESVKASAQLLAFGLYSVMCSSGMRRIVLGGGIEVMGDTFLREVYRALCSRTSLIRHIDLSYAQAGPNADVLGVAEHYLDKVFTITM